MIGFYNISIFSALNDKNLDIFYTKYDTEVFNKKITLEGNFVDNEEKYQEACGEAYKSFSY